jgi:hypothetical protein
MIRVRPAAEPHGFDRACRQRGSAWLADHPGTARPKPFWREFVGDLAEGFKHRCGYSAVMIQNGTVDHFLSWKRNPNLAYEWSNFRYVDGRINAKKHLADGEVLDPFEVDDDWFEIILPSLQLRLTDRVPRARRERARYTIERLGLSNDEQIVTYRAQWYCQYHCGGLSLDGLHRVAPLIARAIEQAKQAPDPTLCAGISTPARRKSRR